MEKPIENPLETLLGKRVKIISPDQRVFVGTLKGIDQTLNCTLDQAEEHRYEEEDEDEYQSDYIGVYLIRGDNVAVIGKYKDQNEEEKEEKE